jgi:hypothetical protein
MIVVSLKFIFETKEDTTTGGFYPLKLLQNTISAPTSDGPICPLFIFNTQ